MGLVLTEVDFFHLFLWVEGVVVKIKVDDFLKLFVFSNVHEVCLLCGFCLRGGKQSFSGVKSVDVLFNCEDLVLGFEGALKVVVRLLLVLRL